MVFPFGVTMTRYRAVPEVDAYGDTIQVTYSDVAEVRGCGPYVSARPVVVEAGRSAVVTLLTVVCSFDADFRFGDRVEFEGRTWQASGEIERLRNPFTGWEAGAQIVFEMVEG